MENAASFISSLLVVRRKTHTHTEPCGHKRNGPQMLCPGPSEEDILTTAWRSCQVFTANAAVENMQGQDADENLARVGTHFPENTIGRVFSSASILHIALEPEKVHSRENVVGIGANLHCGVCL